MKSACASLYCTLFMLFLLLGCATAQRVTEKQLFQETGKLYSELEVSTRVRQGKLASSPRTALVTLVFNRKGRLLTAKQYNSLIDNNSWDDEIYEEFWTDFTTYQTVLRKAQKLSLQSQARVDLIRDYRYVVPPYDPKNKGHYHFDPFQRFYQTWDESERAMKRKTRRQAP